MRKIITALAAITIFIYTQLFAQDNIFFTEWRYRQSEIISNTFQHQQFNPAISGFCFQSADSSIVNLKQRRNLFKDIKNYVCIYASDTWHFFKSPFRMSRKNVCWLSGTFAVGGLLYAYDRQILAAIHRNEENPPLSYFTRIGEKIEPYGLASTLNPYYVAGAVVGYAFRIRKLEEMSIQLHEALFIGALFRKMVVHLTGRARPRDNENANYFKFNSGTSFFSGHTANAFEMATILSHHADFLPFTIVCYGFASIIGLQRLNENAHWPADVFIGAVYGITLSKTLIKLHEKRKLKSFPKVSANFVGLELVYELGAIP